MNTNENAASVAVPPPAPGSPLASFECPTTPRLNEVIRDAHARCFSYDEDNGWSGNYEGVLVKVWGFARLLERENAELRERLKPKPRHDYWRAGEPDCPKDIKAANGELHTLRCRVCGEDDPRTMACAGVANAQIRHADPRP